MINTEYTNEYMTIKSINEISETFLYTICTVNISNISTINMMGKFLDLNIPSFRYLLVAADPRRPTTDMHSPKIRW